MNTSCDTPHEPARGRFAFRWLSAALCGTMLLGAALCAAPAGAQQAGGTTASQGSQPLPNAPEPKTEEQGTTARFVGYMTKRSLFFPDIASSPYPLSTWQKFQLFGNESIAPEVVLVSAVSAAYNQARDNQHGYGQGWEGYGKRLGASMARGSSNSFFGTFALASALHQDPRYFPHSNPTFWSAVKYASRRLVITQTDSGREVVNTSGLLGPAMGESLAMLYLPVKDQTGARTAERYGTDMAWRFAGNMLKEYWPTFFRQFKLENLKVVPAPSSPPAQVPVDHKQ